MNGLAPIHIKPLLEIHCFPLAKDQHYVTKEVVMELFEMGLIEKYPTDGERAEGYSDYKTTEKGDVYIRAIENVPLPIQKWSVVR